MDGHADVLMESVMALTQRMSVAQRSELAKVLASLDVMWWICLTSSLEIYLELFFYLKHF